MKREHLQYLVCPECKGDLTLEAFAESAADVLEGILICGACNCFYPVMESVPRVLDQKQLAELVTGYADFTRRHEGRLGGFAMPSLGSFATDWRIASGFKFEWEHHSEILKEHEDEFLHVLGDVVARDDFRGEVVLDAGCGQGRFSSFVNRYGARFVVSMDLGEAVLIAKRNLAGFDNSLLVQASIYRLPFRPIFDRVISIGVIHHTPEPERAFHSLCELLKPGGSIFIWVYGYSSIIPIIKVLRRVTRGRSDAFNRAAALPFAVVLYSLTRVYKALRFVGLHRAAELVPWNMYHDRRFSNIWTITFDKLNSHIAVYSRRKDLEGWIERTPGRKRAVLDARYPGKSGSSWRLLIQKGE